MCNNIPKRWPNLSKAIAPVCKYFIVKKKCDRPSIFRPPLNYISCPPNTSYIYINILKALI